MRKVRTHYLTAQRQWLLFGCITILLGLAIGGVLYSERSFVEKREQERLKAMTRVMQLAIEQHLMSTSQSLADVRTLIHEGSTSDKLNFHLRTIAQAMPIVRSIFIVDAEGVMRAASRPELLEIQKNYSDRDYFQQPKLHPDSHTLYISTPFVTVLGTYTIALTRMITGADNEFAGVVTAVIDPAYFDPLLESVRYAPDVAAGLHHGDGLVFLMAPHTKPKDALVRTNLAKTGSFFSQHSDSGQDLSVFSGTELATGELSMVALRDVQPAALQMDKPIGVAISRMQVNIYAQWCDHVLVYSGLGAIVTLLFALALYAYQRRHKALLDSEALFHLAIDSMQEGFILFGPDEQILKYNSSAARILGLTESQLSNLTTLNTALRTTHEDGSDFPSGSAPAHIAVHQGVASSNVIMGVHARDGAIIWILTGAVPIGDSSHPSGAVVTFLDITERKKTADALRETDRRLRLALNTNKIGLWDWNLLTGYVYRTEQIFTASGYTPEDDTHDFNFFVRTIHPQDLAGVIKSVEDYREGIASELRFEFRLLNKQGISSRLMEVIGRVVERDEQGKPTRIAGTQTDITDRKRIALAMQEQEQRLRLATEMADIAVWEYDVENNQMSRTQNHDRLYGMEWQTVWHAETFLDATHPDYRELANAVIQKSLSAGGPDQYAFDFPVIWPDGTLHWLWVKAEVFNRDPAGMGLAVRGILVDVTDRKRAEEKLQRAANVFTHAREGISINDASGAIIDVNTMFTQITGYSRAEVLGQNPRLFKSGCQDSAFYAAMWQALSTQGYWCGELWNRRNNGELYAANVTISAVRDDQGNIGSYVALYSDITAIKEHQKQLEHIAHYDTLTGLPNRLLLNDRLRQAITQSIRRDKALAVVYLDLDDIKTVNDAHGHDAGDAVLTHLSAAMQDALRDGDTLARIGGDEFVAVLVDLDQTEACIPVIERLLTAATTVVTLPSRSEHKKAHLVQSAQVTASIGVTFYPQDNVDADVLLRHADQAMYLAKQAGKNRFQLFDVAQDEAIQTYNDEIKRIGEALDNDEFVLYYQPKVNMRTAQVTGAEALIRWQHPDKGLLPPAAFLPIFEDHPLSIQVGEWVIQTALTQIGAWHSIGLDCMVSVNIGAHQLQQDDFPERLAGLLAAHPEVHPELLQLEVLETSALHNMKKVMGIMQECHALGISFALDDFGTGYSSLTYLRRLPVQVLKIDQSFVRDMTEDTDDLAIVQGVIGLANAFHRQVIAEGVETQAIGNLLLSAGCDLAQGYGIARPMPANDLPAWIAMWNAGETWTA